MDMYIFKVDVWTLVNVCSSELPRTEYRVSERIWKSKTCTVSND